MKFQALLISFIVIAASAAPLEVAGPGNIEVQVCKDGAHGVVGIRKSLAWDKRKLRNVAACSEEEDTVTVEDTTDHLLIHFKEDTVSTPETSGGTRTWEKRALVEDSVFAAETGGGAWIWEKRDGLEYFLSLRSALVWGPSGPSSLSPSREPADLGALLRVVALGLDQPDPQCPLCTGSAVPRISSDWFSRGSPPRRKTPRPGRPLPPHTHQTSYPLDAHLSPFRA
ncbi:hypothetical protein DFH09DRAFT_1433250 [Mycena vulgaris]|nr:hypothetical protein DFH09DRAFT_1433250 [Mycena vulgaris]